MERGIFWDEPVTADDHRRAQEAAEAANRKQRLSDGRATWRIQQRTDDRKRCQECGRRKAVQQYHGRELCYHCSPIVVEALAPEGALTL